jgi:polyisoprenoid-binding protein YceI
MESSKFSKATFKGKVLNFDSKKLTASKTSYEIEGDLTIHGVTKKIKTKINLALVTGKILATSAFSIKLEDYKIAVPNLVKDKIAKDAKIALNFTLQKK